MRTFAIAATLAVFCGLGFTNKADAQIVVGGYGYPVYPAAGFVYPAAGSYYPASGMVYPASASYYPAAAVGPATGFYPAAGYVYPSYYPAYGYYGYRRPLVGWRRW